LRQERDFAESLIETAQTIVLVLDPQGCIARFNQYMERISGYRLAEVQGKDWFTTFLPEINHHQIKKIFSQALHDIPTRGNVNPIITKDGQERQIEWHSKTLKDGEGETVGVLAIGQDITERKRAEEEIVELNRSLQEKNRELEALIYVTSHDLRSPLVNILGFSGELSNACETVCNILKRMTDTTYPKELDSVLEEDIPEAIKYILASGAKMDSLLSSILRLSRLGRTALKIEPIDMNRLIADIVQSMEFQLKETQAHLEVDDLPGGMGDAEQINQVFSNLLDNTLKYLDPNRSGVIKVSGILEGKRVIYSVKDNGIGIAQEHHDKIFELFQQIDPSAQYGEGLGLTIARRIVNRHNGQLWVKSIPGQGSEFFVALSAT